MTASRLANIDGLYDIHSNTMQYPAHVQPTHARWEMAIDQADEPETDPSERLPKLNPVYGRTFRIHDLHLESAPESWIAATGPNGEDRGLSSIPKHILEELPPECLNAFETARKQETDWREKWRSEQEDGMRARIMPSFEWFPK
jgi:chromatin structure-remodeling complex protein RSC7